MIYTPEMMRTLARQHDEGSDTRAALMQAADTIELYHKALSEYADHSNWAQTHGCEFCYRGKDPRDWWQNDGDGWELAEYTLKGE